MSRRARWVLGVLTVAAVTHVGVVWMLPRLIMGVVMYRVADERGVNTVFHEPRASAERRGVVRPSPDLNYSGCLLDVRKGPVQLSVPVSEPYTSLSLFAANTDNVYARNDQETRGAFIELLVAAPGAEAVEKSGTPLVRLPSGRGLALVRRVIVDDRHNEALDRIRRGTVCKAVSLDATAGRRGSAIAKAVRLWSSEKL